MYELTLPLPQTLTVVPPVLLGRPRVTAERVFEVTIPIQVTVRLVIGVTTSVFHLPSSSIFLHHLKGKFETIFNSFL